MYQISEKLLANSNFFDKFQWVKELQEENIVWCLEISNDLKFIAIGGISKDHTVFICNQNNMTLCNQIKATSHQVYLLQFSQNDKYLCVGCYGKQILLWHVDDIRYIKNANYKMVFQTEFGVIARILFFDNEKQLCFQGKSHLFSINLEKNNQTRMIKLNHKPISFDILTSIIYEVGNSGIVYIRDIQQDKVLRFTCSNLSYFEEIVVSRKNYFMVVSNHQNLLFLNTINGKIIRKKKIEGKIQSIKLSLNDQFLIFVNMQVSGQFDKLQFLDVETGQIIIEYQTQLSHPTYISKLMPQKFIFGKIDSIEIWNFNTINQQL